MGKFVAGVDRWAALGMTLVNQPSLRQASDSVPFPQDDRNRPQVTLGRSARLEQRVFLLFSTSAIAVDSVLHCARDLESLALNALQHKARTRGGESWAPHRPFS
jgi:hypothetical protein